MFLKTIRISLVLLAGGWATLAGAQALSSADTNGDGAISREEAMTAQNDSFKRLDDNDDGRLSRDEFDAGQPDVPKKASQADIARRKQIVSRWFDQIDADNDDTITPDEYRDAVAPYFDRLDANHDQKISAQELRDSFQEVDQAEKELSD